VDQPQALGGIRLLETLLFLFEIYRQYLHESIRHPARVVEVPLEVFVQPSEIVEYAGQYRRHGAVLFGQGDLRFAGKNFDLTDNQTVKLAVRRNQSKSLFASRRYAQQAIATLIPIDNSCERANIIGRGAPCLATFRISNTPKGSSFLMHLLIMST